MKKAPFSLTVLVVALVGIFSWFCFWNDSCANSESKKVQEDSVSFGKSVPAHSSENSESTANGVDKISGNSYGNAQNPAGNGNNIPHNQGNSGAPEPREYTAQEEREASPLDLGFIGGEVLVTFDSQLSDEQRKEIAHEIAGKSGGKYEFVRGNTFVLGIDEESRVSEAVAKYRRHSGILHIQKNFVYKRIQSTAAVNDPHYSDQWSLPTVKAAETWDFLENTIGRGYSKTRVVVLDTGMDVSHPDITPALNRLKSVDATKENLPMLDQDIDHHGSHVGGIIAATGNNGIGVAGVASGKNNDIVDLVCVNVFVPFITGPGASTADIVRGLGYAKEIDARVVNMSLGTDIGAPYDLAYHTAIKEVTNTGATVVVAHGNDSAVGVSYPADFDEVISVIALSPFNVDNAINENPLASYSNYGGKAWISAPGTDILSLNPNDTAKPYRYLSGTSMASPLVAGIVAMMYSVNQSLTSEEVKEILRDTALDLNGAGRDVETAWGCIDAFRAVQAAANKDLTGKIPVVNSINVLSASEIELRWRFMRGAEKCEIYRAESENGTYTKVETIDTTSSQISYRDPGLQDEKTYFYKIRFSRVNESGATEYSEYSNIISMTIPKNGKRAYIYNSGASGAALREQGFLNLKDAVAGAQNGQTIELVSDIYLSETLVVSGNKTITLTAGTESARLIKRDSSFSRAIFEVKDGATLNFGTPSASENEKVLTFDGNTSVVASQSMIVVRSTGTANIYAKTKFTNAISTAYGAAMVVAGTATMSGGDFSKNKVIDNNFTARGGAIAVYGPTGVFTMNAGTIKENSTAASAWARGGGVYIEGDVNVADKLANGKFIFNGGEISNNKAISRSSGGGGVEVFGGIFEMNGGKISNNHLREAGITQTEYNGGGVECYGWENYGVPSKFIMTGGEISGNDTGISLSMMSEMYLSGTGKISANTGYGITVTGGYTDVRDSGNTLYMSGGEVVDNIDCPGISLYGGTNYPTGGRGRAVISGGKISGNTNGGIIANFNSLLEVSGGTISGGTNSWSQGISINDSTFYWSAGTIDEMRFYNSPIRVNGDGNDPLTIILNDSFSDYNATIVSYEYPNLSATENAAKAAAGKSRFTIKSPAIGLRQKAADPTKLEMNITVEATNVTLTPPLKNIHIGDTIQLTGTVTPATTTYLPVWTSSHPEVASVSSTGEVRALKFGTTVITLAYGTRVATATINVTVASDTNIGARFYIGENTPSTFNLPELASKNPNWNPFPVQPMYNVDFSSIRTNGSLIWFPQSWGVRATDFFTGELGEQNFAENFYENGALIVDRAFLIAQITRYAANEILPANKSFTLSHDCTTGTATNSVMLAALWRYGNSSDLALIYGGTDSAGRHRVYLVVGSRAAGFNTGKGVVAAYTFPQGINPQDTFHNYLISYTHIGEGAGKLDFYVDGFRVNESPIDYVHAQEKNFLSYGFRYGGEAAISGNGFVSDFTETRSAGAKVRSTKIYDFAADEYFALLVTAEMSGLQWRGGEVAWNAENVWADWTSLTTFANKDAFDQARRGVMLRPSGNFSDETLRFDAAGYEPDFLFVETDRNPKNYVLSGTTLEKTGKIGASYGHLIINGKLGGNDGFNGDIFSGYSGGILQYLPPQNGNAATTEQILNGKISGEISLMKSGPGILTLNAANDYNKGTLLGAGTLKIGNANALGTGVVLLKNGTTLDLSSINETVVASSVFLDAGETVSVKLGERTFATKKMLLTWDAAPEGNFTLSGSTISGATLQKTDTGLLFSAPGLPDEPVIVIGNTRTGTLTRDSAWSNIDWRDSAGHAVPADKWANANISATLTSSARATATLDQSVTLGTLALDGFSALQLSQNLFERLMLNTLKISSDAQVIIATEENSDLSATDMTKFQPKESGNAGTIVFRGAGYAVLPEKTSIFNSTLSLHNEQSGGIIIPSTYAETPLSIANLSGSKNFRTDWGYSTSGNRFISAMQTANTTFSGIFQDASNGRKSALRVAAAVSGATLTLSGANTTSGPLEISDSGRVNLSGSWAGPITVSGTLIASGTAPSELTLNNGAKLDLSSRTSTYGTVSQSVSVPAGARVTISVGNRRLNSGEVLLAWASIPNGDFDLSGTNIDGFELRKLSNGLAVALQSDPPSPEVPVLEISTGTWQPSTANAESTSVSIIANNAWTATSNDTSWLTVSPSSGNAAGMLTLSVAENTGTSERTGKVTIISGNLEKTITVTQPSLRKTATHLDFSKSTFNFTSPKASSSYMQIYTDGYFTVRNNNSWIRVSHDFGVTTTRLTVAVDENIGMARTGIIIIDAPGCKTRTVTVNQVAAAIPQPSAFESWIGKKFPAGTPDADKAPGATPAGDGKTNLEKFVFDSTGTLDPTKPAGAFGQTGILTQEGVDYLQVTFPYNPNAANVSLTAEWFTGATWASTGVSVSPDSEARKITVKLDSPISSTNIKGAIRLKGTLDGTTFTTEPYGFERIEIPAGKGTTMFGLRVHKPFIFRRVIPKEITELPFAVSGNEVEIRDADLAGKINDTAKSYIVEILTQVSDGQAICSSPFIVNRSSWRNIPTLVKTADSVIFTSDLMAQFLNVPANVNSIVGCRVREAMTLGDVFGEPGESGLVAGTTRVADTVSVHVLDKNLWSFSVNSAGNWYSGAIKGAGIVPANTPIFYHRPISIIRRSSGQPNGIAYILSGEVLTDSQRIHVYKSDVRFVSGLLFGESDTLEKPASDGEVKIDSSL